MAGVCCGRCHRKLMAFIRMVFVASIVCCPSSFDFISIYLLTLTTSIYLTQSESSFMFFFPHLDTSNKIESITRPKRNIPGKFAQTLFHVNKLVQFLTLISLGLTTFIQRFYWGTVANVNIILKTEAHVAVKRRWKFEMCVSFSLA